MRTRAHVALAAILLSTYPFVLSIGPIARHAEIDQDAHADFSANMRSHDRRNFVPTYYTGNASNSKLSGSASSYSNGSSTFSRTYSSQTGRVGPTGGRSTWNSASSRQGGPSGLWRGTQAGATLARSSIVGGTTSSTRSILSGSSGLVIAPNPEPAPTRSSGIRASTSQSTFKSPTTRSTITKGMITEIQPFSVTRIENVSIPATSYVPESQDIGFLAFALGGSLLSLPVLLKTIPKLPNDDFHGFIVGLLAKLNRLKLNLPQAASGDGGGCAKSKLKDRDLLSPLKKIFHTLTCAISKLTGIKAKIETPDPPPISDILPSVEDVAAEGDALQKEAREQEKEDEDEDEDQTKSEQSKTDSASERTSISTSSRSETTTTVSSSRSSSQSSSQSDLGTSRYVITPTESALVAEVKEISAMLSQAVGTTNVKAIEYDEGSTIFLARLAATFGSELARGTHAPTVATDQDFYAAPPQATKSGQSDQLKRHVSVEADHAVINHTQQKLQKRAIPYIFRQPLANEELAFISTGIDDDAWNVEGYTYLAFDPPEPQAETTIYVLDTGIDLSNPELSNIRGSTEWLFDRDPYWDTIYGPEWKLPNDEVGHGTGVVSKIGGNFFGVYKNAKIKMVKQMINYTHVRLHGIEADPQFYTPYLLESFNLVRKDIRRNRLAGRAIVTSSIYIWDPSYQGDPWWDSRVAQFVRAVRRIQDLDVLCVFTTNNDGATSVRGAPAVVRRSLSDVIQVGAVDTKGRRAAYSGWDQYTDIGAPGTIRQQNGDDLEISFRGSSYDGIAVASLGSSEDDWEYEIGVSYATPQVAGIAGWLLATKPEIYRRGATPRRLKREIMRLAYRRDHVGSEICLWNGYSSPRKPSCRRGGAAARLKPRQDAGSCPLDSPDITVTNGPIPKPTIIPCPSCVAAPALMDLSPLDGNETMTVMGSWIGTSINTRPTGNPQHGSDNGQLTSTKASENEHTSSHSSSSASSTATKSSTKESDVQHSSSQEPTKPSNPEPTTSRKPPSPPQPSPQCGVTIEDPERNNKLTRRKLDAKWPDKVIDNACTVKKPFVFQNQGARYRFVVYTLSQDLKAALEMGVIWTNCLSADQPSIQPAVPTGPDYWCWYNINKVKDACPDYGGYYVDGCLVYYIQAWQKS